jgi:hypothetical protein
MPIRLNSDQAAMLFGEKTASAKPKRARLRKATAALPENQLEAQIVDLLRCSGWRVARRQSGVFRSLDGKRHIHIGEKGEADWECIRRLEPGIGRVEHFFMEVKAAGKFPDEDQLKFGRLMKAQGFVWVWFDSLEAFKHWYNHR